MEIWFYTASKEPKEAEEELKDSEPTSKDPSLVKSRKAEKFLKQKKLRKEAKKQAKEEVHQTPQAEVLVCFYTTHCVLALLILKMKLRITKKNLVKTL